MADLVGQRGMLRVTSSQASVADVFNYADDSNRATLVFEAKRLADWVRACETLGFAGSRGRKSAEGCRGHSKSVPRLNARLRDF